MSSKSSLLKASMISCALTLALAPVINQAAPQGDRYIVQFKDGRAAAGRAAVNMAKSANVALELNQHDAVAAYLPATALKALRNNPNVEYIELDAKRYPMSDQKEGGNPGVPYGIDMVGAVNFPEVTNGTKTVCIIDSGIDLTHDEFNGQGGISGTSDSGTGDWFTDENHHGTHVAGTVAAEANGLGVVGVNSNGSLKVHIIKVFNADGWGYSSGLVAALDACEAAMNGNSSDLIVSMSLGGGVKSRTEDRAFKAADGRGVLSIAAAGNDGNTRHSYPASYNSVISVAAVDEQKNIASFSQQTNQVELAGPGVSVLSSVPMGTGQTASVDNLHASAMDGSLEGSPTGLLVDCGLGTSACPGGGGQVCLIQRGDISFADKIAACEAGSGIAAVVYNNEPGALLGTLGGAATTIVSVGVSQADGVTLTGQLGDPTNVTVAPDDYAFFDGTSMATPHVSGVAALVWNNHPTCTNDEIRSALAASAEDLGAAGRDNAFGYGLVSAGGAMTELMSGCSGSGGGGGGSCTAGQTGDPCSTGSDCCSGSCKGKPGSKSCK
jgi:subtilisin family serine protease